MISDPTPTKAWFSERAQALGFLRVGFCGCEPFEQEREHLARWLAEGGADLFPYMAGLEERLDPRALLAGARTALVGFFPYARPEAIPGAVPGSLKLSRYLWGRDYHQTLKARLQKLLAEAQSLDPGLEGRVCVDTAPVMERQLAARSGLGWQGRHTLLIAGKDGSWGFLGVLLLNRSLEADRPFEAHRCGLCRACLDACPTGALSEFRLDPRLCLTTYNLETEAEPPVPVVDGMRASGWIEGCDRCQEVCPWNHRPLWGDGKLWGGESPLHTLTAAELPRSTAQWRKLTRRSGLRRVRHRHWLANLRRVLGTDEE